MSNAKCYTKEKFPLPNKIKIFFSSICPVKISIACKSIRDIDFSTLALLSSISDSQGYLGVVIKLTDRSQENS